METTLLQVASALFLICTLIFVRHAFAHTLAWGLTALLLPPSALFFYLIQWKTRRTLALVHLGSTLFLLLAAVLWVRAHPWALEGSRLDVLRTYWAPAEAATPLAIPAKVFANEHELEPFLQAQGHPVGRIRGQETHFIRTTLLNGVLHFKSGDNLIPALEVAISLVGIPLSAGENLLDFTPESATSPEIQILWFPEDGGQPDIAVYKGGYWMQLMLTVKDDPVYSGYVKLRLPDRKQSFVAGEFQAHTRDLRYENGLVDRLFDSNATIEFACEHYLVNKLGNVLEKITGYEGTFFQTVLEPATGRSRVSFQLVDGTVHAAQLELIKGADGWVVDKGLSAEEIGVLRSR